jgi:hypothetical protein
VERLKSLGIIVAGVISFFPIYMLILFWPSTNLTEALSNFLLFIVTAITLVVVAKEYFVNKSAKIDLKTIEVISRFTGESVINKNFIDLVSNSERYLSLLVSGRTDPVLAYKTNSVFSYLEELGVYVDSSLVNFDLVYKFFMLEFPRFYSMYLPYIRYKRTLGSTPESFEYIEKLNDRINERGKLNSV